MRAPLFLWLLRILWLTLPFTAGEVLGDQLDGRSDAVRIVAVALSWMLWACVGVSSLISLPVGLTGLRLASPALALGTVVAAASGPITAIVIVAVVASVLIAALAVTGPIADHCVNGASYGDERRFSLRLPLGFLVGPVPVAWLLCFGGVIVGALLLAARSWFAGAALVVLGVAVAWKALPALHALSNRWLVMVPAGVTLVDHLALAEPVLFAREGLRSVGLAPVDTDAVDLSGHALGAPIEIRLDRAIELLRRTGRDNAEAVSVSAVLVSPASPPAVLRELDQRSGGVFPSVR